MGPSPDKQSSRKLRGYADSILIGLQGPQNVFLSPNGRVLKKIGGLRMQDWTDRTIIGVGLESQIVQLTSLSFVTAGVLSVQ